MKNNNINKSVSERVVHSRIHCPVLKPKPANGIGVAMKKAPFALRAAMITSYYLKCSMV